MKPIKTKKHFKINKNKSRSNNTRLDNKSNYSQQKIVIMFLQMLNTIKLYHWKTISYAQHKATDDLYTKLNANIDTFVEIMLGKTGGRINLSSYKILTLNDCSSISDFTKEVNKYKLFLIGMNNDNKINITNNSDLLNVRDEILGNLNQFTYLLTFK